ncbi:ArsR family transcriptional regulator [Bradyrhizobium sp. R2.2-H]|jgi:DNA-binding transcriptional ArsR family regulator|uniref:ArsR/SmtB family transcription factor n=1 Tax=unclassified Bradyrhizobium TaxID=2631580 RepID=UPI001043C014|nr:MULTISPECIES: metalloregulator ArsR/SmtB family transcription factor [unclassified Bradyrhizobium]TCU68271.1 ArsR family transcriptional regulator [Bradyrhizobium sp. Y-H1]TCU70107.1 ArsR family transcriptional regulator [Bradyrhizobium sp. R2.2-H]
MASRRDAEEQKAADALAALGSRTRLRVFKALVRAGPQGVNIGTLQRHLGVPATTLSHHLTTLSHAGLLSQQRVGREVICTADYKALHWVLEYVEAECCEGIENGASERAKVEA